MENPATWGPAEKIIYRVICEERENRARGLIGLSLTRKIADALREEGLLIDVNEVQGIFGDLSPEDLSRILENQAAGLIPVKKL